MNKYFSLLLVCSNLCVFCWQQTGKRTASVGGAGYETEYSVEDVESGQEQSGLWI